VWGPSWWWEWLRPLWAAGAKALGDPTRLAVALALEAGVFACVCDLAWIVGRDERLVSHHVRLLKAAASPAQNATRRWSCTS
jgi:hypothetical protein